MKNINIENKKKFIIKKKGHYSYENLIRKINVGKEIMASDNRKHDFLQSPKKIIFLFCLYWYIDH